MACGDLRAAFRALPAGHVKFIVAGGVASVLNGAPVNTFDFEIVAAQDEENLARFRGFDFGPLDVLGTIGPGLTYEDLLPHAVEMEIGDGIRVCVLDLETIIAIKEELGSEKDLAVLPLLRRTLQQRQNG
jgi:hypothetical protein